MRVSDTTALLLPLLLAAASLGGAAGQAEGEGQRVYLPPGQNGNKEGVWECPDAVLADDAQATNHDGDRINWADVPNVCTDGARCCYRKHCPDGACSMYCLYRPHDIGFQADMPVYPDWASPAGRHCDGINPGNPPDGLWHPRGVTLESLGAPPQQAPPAQPAPAPQPAPESQQPAEDVQQEWSGIPESRPHGGVAQEVWLSEDTRGDKTGVWDCPDAVLAIDQTGSNAGAMVAGSDVPSACSDGQRCCYRRHCPHGVCSLFCLYRPHDPYYTSPTMWAYPDWSNEPGKSCPPYTDGMELWYVDQVANAGEGVPSSGAQATPDLQYVGCTAGLEVFVREAPTECSA